jgi:hypothetical protein
MNYTTLLAEKIRQRNLTGQLNRSKAVTTAEVKMPLLDSLAAAAKTHGIASDEIVAKYVSGEIRLPEVDAVLAASKQSQGMRFFAAGKPATAAEHAAHTRACQLAKAARLTATPAPAPNKPSAGSAPTATAPAPKARRMMNPPPTQAATRPQSPAAPTGILTLDGFRALSPAAKMDFVKSGGKLSN